MKKVDAHRKGKLGRVFADANQALSFLIDILIILINTPPPTYNIDPAL
jgi:hypothetical protein